MHRPLNAAEIQVRATRWLGLGLLLGLGLAPSSEARAASLDLVSPIHQALDQTGTESSRDAFACPGDFKYEQFPDNVAAIPAQDQCGQWIAQAADDFPGMGDRVIGFSWWGIYQHAPNQPPPPPQSFTIEIYTTTLVGQPDQIVYANQFVDYIETREPTQNDQTLASYCIELPDEFFADAGQNFVVSITADFCEPAQWAWLTAQGNTQEAWVRIPGDVDEWTPVTEVYGITTDLAFGVLCMPTRVDITKSIPGWWPGFGNVTTYTSRIYWFDPRTNDCIYPGPPKYIQFDLDGVSRELGFSLNQGIRPSLDLHFNTSENGSFIPLATVFEQCDFAGVHDHWTSVRTVFCTTEATVHVLSEDYGSYGFIEASAYGCEGPDPSPILPREVGAAPTCSPGPARTKIPRDDNGNDIEDTFVGDSSNGNTSPVWDAETLPNPLAPSTGDGLTRYEEWRGLSVMGTHTRYTSLLKDLFVYRENGAWGAADAATVATIRWIRPNEMNGALHDPGPGTVNAAVGPRIVNFNRTSHTLHDQHGLWRRVAGGDGNRGNWGLTRSNTGTAAGPIGPPRLNGRIEIYSTNITAACADAVGRVFRIRGRRGNAPAQFASVASDKAASITNFIIGHEMGHAINLRHHTNARRYVGHGPRAAADGWFNVNTTRPISTRTSWTSVTDERSCCMAYGFFDIWNSVSLAQRFRPHRWTSTSSSWEFLVNHSGFGTTCSVPGQPACRRNVKIDDAD